MAPLDGWARRRAFRGWVRSELRAMEIRPPLSITMLSEAIARRRGRPIILRTHRFDVPGPLGLWVATGTVDHVLYEERTTPVHQRHIILHELGHVLAAHARPADDEPAVLHELGALLPNLSPDLIRNALGRTAYDAVHEREAELVATTIMEWAAVLDNVDASRPAPTAEAAGRRRELEDALSDHLGWL